MKLPLELLKEKYIPLFEFPELYNIKVSFVKKLINTGNIPYTEFRATDSTKRSIHANIEDVMTYIQVNNIQSSEYRNSTEGS